MQFLTTPLLNEQMTEDFVRLNIHEIEIILSSLQLLNNSMERLIEKEHGSVSTLYNKLYTVSESLNND